MIDEEYEKLRIQKELIDIFTEEFNKRLGYRPVVITKTAQEVSPAVDLMSLIELKEHFNFFLPVTQTGKKIPLEAKSRINELVELRHMYFYLARSMGYKLVAIARSLNKLDHTTVIHGLRTFHNLMEVDERYKEKFLTILNYIKTLKNGASIVADGNKV
jgi:hypothetical protein